VLRMAVRVMVPRKLSWMFDHGSARSQVAFDPNPRLVHRESARPARENPGAGRIPGSSPVDSSGKELPADAPAAEGGTFEFPGKGALVPSDVRGPEGVSPRESARGMEGVAGGNPVSGIPGSGIPDSGEPGNDLYGFGTPDRAGAGPGVGRPVALEGASSPMRLT